MGNKAFFFDRDGIVNVRKIGDYVKKVEDFKFLPNFFNIFKAVKESGYLAILVTNQQGIGKGLYSSDDLIEIHNYMQESLLKETGYFFDDIFYCPNLDSDNARCRKPAPGMLLEAKEKFNLNLSESFMIGDSISDVKAGKSAGCHTILIGDFKPEEATEADYIFESLEKLILYLLEKDLF